MTSCLRTSAAKNHVSEYLVLNFEFHLFFPRMSSSAELLETLLQLREKIFRFYHIHLTVSGTYEESVKDHKQIVDVLKGKIQGTPRKLMEKHADRTRRPFMDFYRKLGFQSI